MTHLLFLFSDSQWPATQLFFLCKGSGRDQLDRVDHACTAAEIQQLQGTTNEDLLVRVDTHAHGGEGTKERERHITLEYNKYKNTQWGKWLPGKVRLTQKNTLELRNDEPLQLDNGQC